MTWHEFLARADRLWPDLGWAELLPALLAGLATILLLRVGLGLLVRRLRALSARTRTTVDDHLVGVLERTNTALIWITGLLVGLKMLPLDDRWHDRVGQLWFAVVALQLGLWAQEAVARLMQAYQLRHGGGAACFRPLLQQPSAGCGCARRSSTPNPALGASTPIRPGNARPACSGIHRPPNCASH